MQRVPLLALPLFPLVLSPFDAAWAACSPAAGNGVIATCTGSTTNQDGTNGFGTGTETGASVLVLSGASVTGSAGVNSFGVALGNGSVVTNAGSVGGYGSQVSVGTFITGDGSVTNSGTITGQGRAVYGVFILGNGTVTNTGSIAALGGFASNTRGVGVQIGGTGAVTNSNTIRATGYYAYGVRGGSGVTNAGTIEASGIYRAAGILLPGNGTVTNTGQIVGTSLYNAAGVLLGSGAVTNTGSIVANGAGTAYGIQIAGDGRVTNTGTISAMSSGVGYGVSIAGNGTVINSGRIEATAGCGCGAHGIFVGGDGNVINSGSIIANGPTGVGIRILGTGTISNSGLIAGPTTAIAFNGVDNTLNLLPGSTIIGAIDLNGAGDTVNVRTGNQNLTFNTLAGVTVTSNVPYVVSGNRVVTIDPTPFALGWRTLGDVTGAVSGALPQVGGSPGGSSTPLGFAAPDAPSRIEQAFAALPGLSAYAGDGIAFKAPTVAYADGWTVWSRGFAGVRSQPGDGALVSARNEFYGGMVGFDRQVRPDLRLGAFAGAGHTTTGIANGASGASDLGFAGLAARFAMGSAFLNATLQGGAMQASTSRIVNNNLVANGLERAAANYNGWYVSPEAQIGTHIGLGRMADAVYMLTPSLKLRYLYGAFGGYTETGTTAPLTVGARSVNVLDERGELKLTRTVSFSAQTALALSAFAGLQGSQLMGGGTVPATLLGQAIPFATPGKTNLWGGYGGSGLEWRIGTVGVYAAGEYLALSDGSHVVSGRGGLRVAF
ncbi:autotransporter outer membrane beta-barrel domain-containing protein [Bradyrhizobium sp. HKCCYLS2038]|uniref:autotransporter outer membrane beta-barrel domain-containing protein n=1 Tax=unclassified Bradyrhizobium TaxID=2631580 RepID=UPI003EBF2BD0